MSLKIPDVLRYEIRHRLESLRGTGAGEGPREWLNAHPLLAFGSAGLSLVLVVLVLGWTLWPASAESVPLPKKAWFYDINTSKLFEGNPKKTGPVAAPSGPATHGEFAGFRAHVYSYVRDPNESELFVGFLEQPDPEAAEKCSASDMRDFNRWSQSRLIRRPKDKKWVQATSPEGQAILQEMLRPNKKGQTPIYQVPRE